jgi:pimeloyl-ACP methyl ester carboxylesterase
MSMTTKICRAIEPASRSCIQRHGLAVCFVLSMLLLFAPPLVRADFSTAGEVAGLTAHFMNVNGVRTRYYEAGSGEPIVLVHGGDFSGHSSANVWSRDIPLFAKRFHVLAPDALASGLTDNPADDNDLNIQGEVDHLYDFIRALKLGTVHLVGEGRGGGCVFFLALQHPDVVKDVVIVNSNTAAPSRSVLLPIRPSTTTISWKANSCRFCRSLSRQPQSSRLERAAN